MASIGGGMILRHASDWRPVLTTLGTTAVLFGQWAGILHGPWMWILGVVLVYQTYLVNHNHQHLPAFTWNWLNRAFDLLLSLSSGIPASMMILMHNRNHHHERNGPEDYMCTRCARGPWPVTRLLSYPIAVAVRYAPRKRRMLAAAAVSDPPLHRRITWERVMLITLVATLFVLRPRETLWAVMLPWALGQYWVVNANFLQHDGCDHVQEGRHSRDITSRLVNWLTFNGGYHTVHHEQPGLHWSQLPVAHAQRLPTLEPTLQHRSFLTLLWRLASGRTSNPVSP
jgi:fatty acid desaturase